MGPVRFAALAHQQFSMFQDGGPVLKASWPHPNSQLKSRRMDASSVRFQLAFARTRRPNYVFQQAANAIGKT